jgi:glycosyltransferase involved in cell wall biosynthesis
VYLAEEKGISVVISTYSKENQGQVLDCIRSLREQSFLPNEILLILDHNPDLVSFFKSVVPSDVKVVMSDGFGLSYARNAGAKKAKSEIVAFIDDDAIAHRDWLGAVFKNFSEPSVVGVGGLVAPLLAEGKSFEWFPEELNWVIGCSYKGLSNRREAIRNPIGCNMSFRRSIFEDVGYFRHDVGRLGKTLLDGEEPEFSMRVLRKNPGAKIMNDPSAVVLHNVSPRRMTFKYLLQRSFYQGFSKALISETLKESAHGLNLERGYLKYLLTSSVKSRFSRVNKFKNLSQLFILFISSLLVFFGFAIGKVHEAVD